MLFPILLLLSSIAPQDSARAPAQQQTLDQVLADEGLRVDLERGLVGMPASVLVREELLEYVLVGPRGATHESLFLTDVKPSILNTALLLLGVEPGRNATIRRSESEEEAASRFDVTPPSGDGFFLYAGWREGEETYFFRVEDLVANLETRRTLPRHRWVYLGSRFRVPRGKTEEVFVADLEENLISLCFFYEGNTLLTARPPECEIQTIWIANSWLVPPRGEPVEILFSRERLDRLPDGWSAALPVVGAGEDEDAGDE
ncbi:MAG TPA: hypothetical protein ENJ09_01875 [Planctomycetes bacterium]|nr:hypothetical protein [Planctomycetota bacterium]